MVPNPISLPFTLIIKRASQIYVSLKIPAIFDERFFLSFQIQP